MTCLMVLGVVAIVILVCSLLAPDDEEKAEETWKDSTCLTLEETTVGHMEPTKRGKMRMSVNVRVNNTCGHQEAKAFTVWFIYRDAAGDILEAAPCVIRVRSKIGDQMLSCTVDVLHMTIQNQAKIDWAVQTLR